MMTKLEKLLDLTIAWLERDLGQAGLPLEIKETPGLVEPRKGRKHKPKETPAETVARDPETLETVGGLSEEESAKEIYVSAKALLKAYPVVAAGQTKPEGYFIAQKLLVEEFNAGALKDLVHPQRLQFIVKVKDLLAKVAVPAELGL